MQLDWVQIAIVALGGLLLLGGLPDLAGIKVWLQKLLGGLSLGGTAKATAGDQTLARVEAWQTLYALCDGDCPEAVKLLDGLFPHLRPGHTHEPAAREVVK